MPDGELSEEQRGYAMGQVDAGLSAGKVSKTLRCTPRAIQKLKRRCYNTNTTTSAYRTGRPPILNRRERRRLVRAAKKFPKIQWTPLFKEAGLWDYEKSKPTISRPTAIRILKEEELFHFRSKRRPLIDATVAKLRLQHVDRWSRFDFSKKTVILTDECSVARGSGHNPTWVWRLPNQKWEHDYIEEVKTGRQPARMVWGAIWIEKGGGVGRSDLIVMTRDTTSPGKGYTAWSYIQALKKGLKASWARGQYFMQDNARIHTAEKTLDYLETRDLHVIEWPPYSPDLNPIEHVWLALKRKLHELHPEFDTMGKSDKEWKAFEAGLVEAWWAIPDTLLEKLILSIPDRHAACKAANGYQTKY